VLILLDLITKLDSIATFVIIQFHSMALQPHSGLWPPSEDASIRLLLFPSILLLLLSAICPSGRRPTILFLVFPLVLYVIIKKI
jgi:hypothetical protein